MTGDQVDLIIAYLGRKNYGQFYSNHPQQFCTFFSSDILEICICLRGPSDRMRVENRPFDVPFAAGGDMATVTWSNLPERLKGRSVALIVRRMPEAEPNLPPDNCS